MIHSIQTGIGVVFLATFGSLTVGSFIPDPHPIKVHDLYFDGRNMIQDRTISASDDGEFSMQWSAKIVKAGTDEVIPGCIGSDWYIYPSGHKAAEMPLEVWVGNDLCKYDDLPPGQYEPVGSWVWGDSQVSKRGQLFTKE